MRLLCVCWPASGNATSGSATKALASAAGNETDMKSKSKRKKHFALTFDMNLKTAG